MQIALIIQQYISGANRVAVSAGNILSCALIDIQHFGKSCMTVYGACDSGCGNDLLGSIQQTWCLTGYKAKWFRHGVILLCGIWYSISHLDAKRKIPYKPK